MTTEAEPTNVQVGELIGWRAWRYRRWRFTGTGPRIYSTAMKTLWRPNLLMAGEPWRSSRRWKHTHGEGVYAWQDRDFARHVSAYSDEPFLVFGSVWLWGRVTVHDRGYRAEYAYPRSFEGIRGPMTQRGCQRMFRLLERVYLGESCPTVPEERLDDLEA